MPDPVNQPDHYTWHPAIECIKVTQEFNFNLGNAIKYIWRAGRKQEQPTIQDLEKARKYIEFEIDRIASL